MLRGGQCWGAARDSQGSRCHIQPSPRGQPVLMGSLGCSACRAWLVTGKEEQEHSDRDFNPLSRAPITHPTLLYSLPLETPGRAHHEHRTALQSCANTPETFSVCSADENGGKPTLLHRSQISPLLPSPHPHQKVALGQGTRSLSRAVPQRTVCPVCHAQARHWDRQREGFVGSGTASSASHGASFPGTGSLISSIGFNSSPGSGNVIFNTLEGSLSRRCLFHHLCPSGAHFKLAKHHLLGKQ